MHEFNDFALSWEKVFIIHFMFQYMHKIQHTTCNNDKPRVQSTNHVQGYPSTQ
jgi:hypothetical protein